MTKQKKKKRKWKNKKATFRPKTINLDTINLHRPFGIAAVMHERDRQLEDLIRNPEKYRKGKRRGIK